MQDGPLSDIRVIELGHAVAGPFAATMLADFGADVIKVEAPGKGDSMHTMGPKFEGEPIWWTVAGRNKRSITANVKHPDGKALVERLITEADVVVENYRPGVLDRLGLGWERVHELNPKAVQLSVSGYGQTGPFRDRPGFGKIGEAMSGATNITGDPDRPPVHPGYSLADAVTGLYGAYGIMLALHHAQRTGEGQLVDLALYEGMFRIVEWQIPLFAKTGVNVIRNGAKFPFDFAFITDICPTRDGGNVVVSAATNDMIARLNDLLISEGFATEAVPASRQLSDTLMRWCADNDTDDVLKKLEAADLVAGPILTPKDIYEHPQFDARNNIVHIEDHRIGDVAMPNVVPTLTGTPGRVRWTGPDLGQHSDEVYASLGLDPAEIVRLRSDGAI